MTASTLLTADDLERMPDDGNRYELIRGALKQMPPTGLPHAVVSGRLITYMNQYLEAHNLGSAGGEGGFILEDDPDTVLAPDLAVFPAHVFENVSETGFMRFVPPLVAEVISPSNRRSDIEQKVRIYLQAGVQVVWVVDPKARTVRVRSIDGEDLVLTEGTDLTGGTVYPDFRVPLERLFRWLA